ncbi:uncharacterized protein LOC134856523 [Symsagittifera roscoffensis]|uniref:uncharacterized protein LOC134856523 n=1 Tax=Symsagittifera roscoffensis TaxID=84072 RepID=UPI00307C5F95
MAWVVAASSLFHSLNTLRPAEKAELDELVYAESGLSLNPHTVRKRQNLQTLLEEHPLVDKEIILWHDVPGEKLCEIEAAAKSYAKRVRQTPSDRGIEKARKYLKDNGLLAVPFDKGVGFCVMKKTTYEAKLTELLQSEQFSEKPGLTDSVVMKIEKDINKELLAMKKKDEIDEALYSRLRSTGGQPARLYGLAKVHKKGTPLRPVLSLPGSSYEHLNKTLAKFFDNIEGANIETNTQMAREIIENIDLDYNESIISLDVKSLYTNVPLKEAIDIALRKLYEQTSPPKLARGTMKKLLNMARCKEQRDQEKPTENVKAFLRYVDDIVRTVKGDPDIVLKAANELHPNLQFTIENPDSNGDLAFLDLNNNVDSRKKGCMEDVLRRNELGAVPSEVFLRIHNNNNNNNNPGTTVAEEENSKAD